MPGEINFLLIDESASVLDELESLVKSAFPESFITKSNDGGEGFLYIQKEKPELVICGLDIFGINGLELIKKAKTKVEYPGVFIIALISKGDSAQRAEALGAGADDYLEKPLDTGQLASRLITAVRTIHMQKRLKEENELLQELNDELEKDLKDMINLCVKFLQARIPSSKELLKRAAAASVWIGENLGLEQEAIREIEISAMLAYAGKVSLPDNLIKMPVMIDGAPSHNLMSQIPASARDIVSSLRRFKSISETLYHIYENYDGSGFPGKLKKWQIPIASRIIRVALDYEEARFFTSYTPAKIIEELRKEDNRLYDQRVVALLEQYLAIAGEAEANITERAVQFSELEEGMALSRDVYTNSGLKLMSAGTLLTEKYISRILLHNSSDPILGNIIIRVN